MYKFILLIISGLLIFSTVPLGSQNNQNSGGTTGIRRIGFTEPDSLDKLKKIYPKTAFVQKGTLEYTFSLYTIDSVKLIKGTLSFDNPDPVGIQRMCNENNLDVLMLTRLVFIYQKLHKYYQAEAELKFFDRQGNLMFQAKCNTFRGKNYYPYPELYEVERDALNCGIGKFAKEFKLKKRK
jgi:hypothetical protein